MECQDIELDMEREQMETPNVACLPTVLVSDIPTKKQYFVPNQVHDRIHYQPTQEGFSLAHSQIDNSLSFDWRFDLALFRNHKRAPA